MVKSVRVRGAYQLITDTLITSEPKTLFKNKTKQIIYLVTSFDKYFKYYKIYLQTQMTYMTPTLKYLEDMLKYVTYTTQLEANIIF